MQPIGTKITTPPAVGSVYLITHKRFGVAEVKVDSLDNAFAICTIIKGTLRGMLPYNTWGPGTVKPLRMEFVEWYLVPKKNGGR